MSNLWILYHNFEVIDYSITLFTESDIETVGTEEV